MSDESGFVPSPDASETSAVEASDSVESQDFSGQDGSQSEQIDAINEAVENGDLTPKEAQRMVEKFELKVRGKIIEREVDLSDKEYIKQQLQLAEMSKVSMQEKAEQERMFREILSKGKDDVGAFLKEVYGIDPDEWAASHIEKKIEHMKKSPEVLAQEKLQEELRLAREEAKRLKDEKEMAEMSKLQQEAMNSLQEEISTAIQAHTKLPNSKMVQKRMAQALNWAVNNGHPDATAEDVAPLVEHEMRQELNELYDQMPEEALEAYFGRKNIDRLRKSKIAKANSVQSASSVKATAAPKVEQQKSSEKINAKDFWRRR